MWTYNVSTGTLGQNGNIVDTDCYSGAYPDGFNDATKQNVPDVGPIPEGFYTIEGPPYSDTEHGPYILRLEPDANNVMFGRVGFLLHGKPKPPADIRSGSKGCICAGPATRSRVWQSGDSRLQVISGIVVVDPEISV
jgi:hypothetical protein